MTLTPSKEWTRGWPVVLAGLSGMILTNLHAGTISVMMAPLQQAYGWSRAEISSSILLICIFQLAFGPVVGLFADRIGPRRVALTGVLLFSVALFCVGLSGPGIVTWYIAWAVVGLTYPMASTVIWTMGISRCFVQHRGLAFSVALAGTGLANLLTPIIAVAALPVFGWRGTFFALALGGLVIAWPTVWLFFKPDQIMATPAVAAGAPKIIASGYSSREVFRHIRFWMLATTMLLVAGAIGVLSLHFQPIMRDAGLSAAAAAGYAALAGPALIAGRILGGYLLDRLSARLVAAVAFALPALACAILLNSHPSPVLSITTAVIIGLSAGAEGDVVAYLVARYFGLKRYGVTYAILYGLYAFGFGLAPVIAGGVFDVLGSYDVMLSVLIIGLLVSGLLAALLGKPPVFAVAETLPTDEAVAPAPAN